MGNTCSRPRCSGKGNKDKQDQTNPALLLIREAQQKYFNSHIESDADDSDDNDMEPSAEDEDSVDMCYSESEASLGTVDGVSVDSELEESNSTRHLRNRSVDLDSIVGSGGTTLPMSPVHFNSAVGVSSSALRDSGNGSATCVKAVVHDTSILSDSSSCNTSMNNNKLDLDISLTASVRGNGSVVTPTPDIVNITDNSAKSSAAVKSKKQQKKASPVKKRPKRRHISLRQRGDFFSIFNQEDKKARAVDPGHYQYPFENLVFEGGGNKGLAYCGAVRLLEDLNIWPQIKRLAGTSAGAMTAALLAVGYNSHDLEQFFSLNLNNIFLDHRFGYLSLIPNLLSSYGWNPGKRIYKWFGHKLADKTGNADITFKEVNEMYQRELCIVATNLNQMTSLYCHPKTTPDMPVRLAVRMSMSIPGMFKAVRHTVHGQTDIFVDGGVLCNYPIHCFDGWWLSMEPDDNFLEKLQPLEDIPRLLERTERFGQYNEKTLGMQLYSDNEQDLLKYQLENLRHGVQLQELPNTKLAREKIKKKKLQLKTDREHRRLVKAMNAFLRALRKHNLDKNDNIDRQELEAALNDVELFPRSKRLILFGDVESDVILEYLDSDQNGLISYQELIRFMEETGISMQNRFLGYQRRNITNLPSFLDTLQATLLTNVKRVYVEERDLKRTVGINTGHVGTSDFVLEPADIEFVLERGKRSLEAFLKYYVASHRLKKRPEFRRPYSPRKESKASLMSSDSNSSIGNIEETHGITGYLPRKTSQNQHLSPIPSESGTADDVDIPEDKEPVSVRSNSIGVERSSSKHVVFKNEIHQALLDSVEEFKEQETRSDKISGILKEQETTVPTEEDCDFTDNSPLLDKGVVVGEHDILLQKCDDRLSDDPHVRQTLSDGSHGDVNSASEVKGAIKVLQLQHETKEDEPSTPLLVQSSQA